MSSPVGYVADIMHPLISFQSQGPTRSPFLLFNILNVEVTAPWMIPDTSSSPGRTSRKFAFEILAANVVALGIEGAPLP
jgi:hypothetical protein